MNFKILEDNLAKSFINDNESFENIRDLLYFTEWIDEKNVKLYLLYEDDIIKSFALLSKMDKDPLKIHLNPYHLNYICTFENERRKGYAYNLSLEMKKEENITIFCMNEETINLFKKAEYNFQSYDPLYKTIPIYRYP